MGSRTVLDGGSPMGVRRTEVFPTVGRQVASPMALAAVIGTILVVGLLPTALAAGS